MEHRLPGKEPHIVSLVILSAFASMGAVLMTPALPQIAHYFSITSGTAQLTVTGFLLGYACGQILYGPLANRFGRKPTFYIGIAVATLGSLFSILSSPLNSFVLLVVGRLLEALGSSVGLVVSFTIVSDFYREKKARRVIAYMMLAFAIVPGVALTIGGFLVDYIDWQSCFYFLLLYGLILIFPAYRLPETVVKPDRGALRPAHLGRRYLLVFRNPLVIRNSLIFGLSTACVYLFATEGPIIGISILGFSPSVYGLLGLIPFLGAVAGSLISARLAHRLSVTTVIKCGYLCELCAAWLLFILFITGLVDITTLLACTFLFLVGHAILSSNIASMTTSRAEDRSNTSAVMNFVQMGVAVVATLVVGLITTQSALVLPIAFVVATALMPVIRIAS